MKILLLGYMASGKSTIGKRLAKELNMNFIDLDSYISEKENATISEIFKTKGEIYFRKKETQYLKEVFNSNKEFILAVGGGTPCYGQNSNIITKNSFSVYLKASISELYKRLLEQKAQRPLVKNISDDKLKEFIAKHLFERSPFYEKATISIVIDNKTIEKIVEEIKLNIPDNYL